MGVRFTDLHCKEVICVSDGRRLGFVSDVQIELPEGNIVAIIVPGQGKCFGLMGRQEDFVIPWCKICRIGPDIVLVDIKSNECRVPKMRMGIPFLK